MEKKITISNPFHNTSVNIQVPESWAADEAIANLRLESATSGNFAKKYARVRKTLCGVEGCDCRGMWRAEEASA